MRSEQLYNSFYYSSVASYCNICIYIRVETGSGHPGHPGHPGHILSGSSGSDPLYKLSGSDPDSTLNHVR